MEKINREELLEEMIQNYGKLIFSICYKLTKNYFDAEDLAQDTFLSAYKNLEHFDGQNEKAWLSRIATNKCLDYLKRAAAKTVPQEDTYFRDVASALPSPEETCMENEVSTKLETLCDSLKEPYCRIARQYFCQQLTIKEISDSSGKNQKTIQTQVYRAKAMLKKLWKEELI